MTVNEVSRLAGVSVRTLQYYDRIGLLTPEKRSGSGYRIYGEKELEKLQQILLLRELEFRLDEIAVMLSSPGFDRDAALKQQIELLTLKKQRLERIISLANDLKKGEKKMDFKAFDNKDIEEYSARAKELWGGSEAYKEYQQKSSGRSEKEEKEFGSMMMDIFSGFRDVMDQGASSQAAQQKVRELQKFITEHYYKCTNEILMGLGQMYGCGGEFTENIDAHAGDGTAAFAAEAIRIFCS